MYTHMYIFKSFLFYIHIQRFLQEILYNIFHMSHTRLYPGNRIACGTAYQLINRKLFKRPHNKLSRTKQETCKTWLTLGMRPDACNNRTLAQIGRPQTYRTHIYIYIYIYMHMWVLVICMCVDMHICR